MTVLEFSTRFAFFLSADDRAWLISAGPGWLTSACEERWLAFLGHWPAVAEAYVEAIAPAREVYEVATAAAWEAREVATAANRKAYGEAIAPARATALAAVLALP